MAFKMPWNKPAAGEDAAAQEEAKKELDAFVGTLMAQFGTVVDEKLKPVREKVEALDGRWTKLEEAAVASGSESDGGSGGAGGNGSGLTPEQQAELERKKLLAISIATNARITEAEALRDIEEKFSSFLPKVKEYLAQTPLERKAMADYPQYCRNVVKMVIGGAALDGGLKFDTGANRFFLEDTAAGSVDGEQHEFLSSDLTWTDPRSGRVLTPLQQLAKLGIKPEEFAKSVKAGVV